MEFCLQQLHTNRYLAVAISLEHAQYTHLISKSKIYCFENPETITEFAVQMLVRKDFPYLNELNAFINKAKESGLILKWLNENRNHQIHKEMHEGYGQINTETFLIIFIAWIGLTFIPSLIFVIERIVFHWAHKQNPTRISIFLEKMINSERYFLLNDIRFK